MAVDWAAGYTPEWRLYRVDERTWADADMVGAFAGATVDRVQESVMESGSFELELPAGGEFAAGYYRLAMVAHQGGLSERADVATLLCCSTSGTASPWLDRARVSGRSVLYPASREGMPIGKTAPAGCDGVDWAASLLSGCLVRPVEASGSFTLDSGMSFAPSDRKLDAAWAVLAAGGWCIQVDGRGTVSLLPRPTEPALELDAAGASLLMPDVDYDLDYSQVPNRYRAMDGGLYAESVNDDPASPSSVHARGYYDDGEQGFDDAPARVNGETLQAYADRRLAECSVVRDGRVYSREWWPGVHPWSVVRGSLAGVRLEGDLRVARQSIDTSAGLLVTEEAYREVSSWRA